VLAAVGAVRQRLFVVAGGNNQSEGGREVPVCPGRSGACERAWIEIDTQRTRCAARAAEPQAVNAQMVEKVSISACFGGQAFAFVRSRSLKIARWTGPPGRPSFRRLSVLLCTVVAAAAWALLAASKCDDGGSPCRRGDCITRHAAHSRQMRKSMGGGGGRVQAVLREPGQAEIRTSRGHVRISCKGLRVVWVIAWQLWAAGHFMRRIWPWNGAIRVAE